MSNWSDRINRVVVAGSVAVLAGSVGLGIAHGDAVPTVTICHLPPGNPTNVQLITVGAPAVARHVAQHGDGVCADGDSDCCADDDGAVCTNVESDVNHCGSCGNSCSAGETCEDGECEAPPNNHVQANCNCVDENGEVAGEVIHGFCEANPICPPLGESPLCEFECDDAGYSSVGGALLVRCRVQFFDLCPSLP